MSDRSYQICALPSGEFTVAELVVREVMGERRPWVEAYHGMFNCERAAEHAAARLRQATSEPHKVAA